MQLAHSFITGLSALLTLAATRLPQFDCTVQSNTTMVEDAWATQAQYGAASEIQAGLKQPWPEVIKNGQRVRVVTYCYETLAARQYLDCLWVKDAVNCWKDKLREPHFAGTTNLNFEELSDGKPHPARRQPRPCFDATSHWDTANVPADTLWIGINHNAGATGHSLVGYDALSNVEGRHTMMLGPDVTVDSITHEASERQ